MALTEVRDLSREGLFTSFENLRLGRTGQSIVGRLIRFWDSRNVKKNGEFMGITILLLDELDSVVHGFIPANRASYYRSQLTVGSIFKVDRFEVARCGHTYKITEHQYMLRFLPSTRLCLVESNSLGIKSDKFMTRRYSQLMALSNTNLELPDVVGEIRSVQGADLKNTGESSRVVVRLLIDADTTVYLSLWDQAASNFRGLLGGWDNMQKVMLITTVNPKVFGGNLYLNSTAGTQFYLDNQLPEISEYVCRMGSESSQNFPCVDTLEGINKKELVTIAELNKYISESNEQTQEADFLCKAAIVSVVEENGWSFVSCTGCNKKLERTETSLSCVRCGSDDVTGVLRFRVEFCVDDGDDSATFVVFDKVMTKLVKNEASVLAVEKGSEEAEGDVPDCLTELIGKEFIFQIRVTAFNFTPNHRTFTVSSIIEETESDKNEKDNAGNFTIIDHKVGVGGSPSTKVVEQEEKADEDALSTPQEKSSGKYVRKRRRE